MVDRTADDTIADTTGTGPEGGPEGASRSVRAGALAELTRPDPAEPVWARWSAPWAASTPVWMRVAVLGAVVLAVAGAWFWLRRPPDPVASLPRAPDPAGPSTTVLEPTGASVPGSTSSVLSTGSVTVHVAGAVQRPGVVTLPSGSRAVDAVDAAGGLAPGADADRVNLAAPLADGTRLAVPLVGQATPAEVPAASAGPVGASGAVASPGGPVDLNTADVALLDTLPGVGPSTAAAIVAHREEHGPFTSVEGLLDVRGIGDGRLEAVRDLVTIGR